MAHSSYLSTYRLDNFTPRLHLSIYKPVVACSGTLTATPANSATQLDVSFDVGDENDVSVGFLVRIRDTATQAVKGYTRVRYSGSLGSTTIPVRELSTAQVSCVSGDTFEVLRYVALDTKLTTADATFSPDGISFASLGATPPPLASSGGNSVGWVDDGETFRTIVTDGSNTTLVNPDSSTPPTHSWANDGSNTAFASGSANTDESPTFEANVGSWMIRHAATDPDASIAVVQYTHHVVHDDDHPPYDCILTDYSGDHENGITWSVELLAEDVNPDDFYELALCFLWTDDVFSHTGGVLDLHRSVVSGRSHIVGMGYARRVTTRMSGEDGVERLTLDIQSPLARLQEIASYSKVMLESASPDDWNKVKTLGFRRGISQLVQFYTTLIEAGYDFVYDASFADARYPAHFLQRSDPIAQMRELIDARQGRLVQREWGARFEVQYHPAWLPLADRSADDITLTDADAYEFEFTQELADTIELFELQGITAGAADNVATFSRVGVGGGKNSDTAPRKSPDDQDQANDWAGMVYASRENIFVDADGIKYRVGELTLRCPGQYMVLDFSPDYLRFNYAGRWLDFSAFRFWLKRFSLDVDADTGEPVTTFTWQCETAAPPGVTFVPDPGATTPTDGQPTPYPFPPTQPTDPSVLGSGRYVVVDSNGQAFYTLTGNSANPVYFSMGLSLTGSGIDAVPSAYSPLYRGTGVDLKFWVLTATRIYSVAFDTTTFIATPTAQSTHSTIGLGRIETERGTEGLAAAVLIIPGTSTSVTTTTDDGATWGSPVLINADGGSFGASALYVSGRSGRIFASENKPSTSAAGKVSSNNGASFGALSLPNIDSVGAAYASHIPWHNNAAETIAYFGYDSVPSSGSGVRRIYRADGASQADVSPTFNGSTGTPQFPRAIDTAPDNRLKVAAVLRNGTDLATASSDTFRPFFALDGVQSGASWQGIAALDGSGSSFYSGVRMLGDGSGFLAFGTGGRLVLCDFSGNYRDISGNLATLGCGTIHNIMGF